MHELFESLRHDHYLHRILARRLTDAEDPPGRAARLAALARHLSQHVQAERAVINAALHADADGRAVATQALRGQLYLSKQIAALRGAMHDAELYETLARAYRDEMEQQLRLEEEELFPAAARALSGDAAA